MGNVLALVLGGGQGTRLYPLTKERAKPAVPFGGKYRLIDVPLSNCLNSEINKIAILTQYNSVSLHRHIYSTYVRDMFSTGWIQILAAEQTPQSSDWYQGTADAVRKQGVEIAEAGCDYLLILAGDHLYRMDYQRLLQFHIDNEADITIAVQPVSKEDTRGLGILRLNEENQIVDFVEKPENDEALAGFERSSGADRPFLASMGIYVFNYKKMLDLLASNPGNDFGKHIVPGAISGNQVMGYVFDDYWADIGTIKRFYEVNLALTAADPPFDFYDPERPIYTHPRFAPGCVLSHSHVDGVLLGEGCRLYDSEVVESVVGLRSIIGPQASVKRSIILGADLYETEEEWRSNRRKGIPNIGIGRGSHIEGAIIDKNARIGKNVTIRCIKDRQDFEEENWVAQDGIVIVPKNAVVPDGTVI